MTPRERILTTLARRRPDRIPTDLWLRGDVRRALAERLGCAPGEVAARLGAEGWASVACGLSFPEWETRDDLVTLTGDFPHAGQRVRLLADDVFADEWGTVRRIGADRRYVEWLDGPLAATDDPADIDLPGPERIVEPPDLAARVADLRARDLFVSGSLQNPFARLFNLRGIARTLMDYAAGHAFLHAFYERIYATWTAIAERLAAAGVDMIQLIGDFSMQDRLMMSPAAWRAIDKPYLAAMIAASRAIKPDLNWLVHSDGNYEAVIADLLEIGFDVLNPIQPECMDPAAIKQRWGDRCTLHGTGGIQRTLPFGTPDDCRREVRERIRTCGYNGGLVLMPSNLVQMDTPLDNLLAWYAEAREFDLAGLPEVG